MFYPQNGCRINFFFYLKRAFLSKRYIFWKCVIFLHFRASRGYSRKFKKQIRSFETIKSVHLCLIFIKTYFNSSILRKKQTNNLIFFNFFFGRLCPPPLRNLEKKPKVLWDNYRNATDHIWGAMSPPFYMARTFPPPPLPPYVYGSPSSCMAIVSPYGQGRRWGGRGQGGNMPPPLPSARGGGQGRSVKQ